MYYKGIVVTLSDVFFSFETPILSASFIVVGKIEFVVSGNNSDKNALIMAVVANSIAGAFS